MTEANCAVEERFRAFYVGTPAKLSHLITSAHIYPMPINYSWITYHTERRVIVSKVWVLQHTPVETLGTIARALDSRGVRYEYVQTFEGQRVPGMGDASGLVVMGGPMGAYEQDRYPHLTAEIRLIEQALEARRPVLGVCLGSQLLAAALGAEVRPGGYKEIGWHPVGLAEAAGADPLWEQASPSFNAYHWHGDVFELPKGAVSLACSDLTEHQAYRYGESVYGLLFHLEVTEPIVKGMTREFADELREEGLSGEAIVEEAAIHLPVLRPLASAVFTNWAERIRGAA